MSFSLVNPIRLHQNVARIIKQIQYILRINTINIQNSFAFLYNTNKLFVLVSFFAMMKYPRQINFIKKKGLFSS